MRTPYLACLPLLLTHCVDPYGNPKPVFGPARVAPYGEAREQLRVGQREQAGEQARLAYERGLDDGRSDALAGEPGRPGAAFDSPALQAAYEDGYTQGHGEAAPPTGTAGEAAYRRGYQLGLQDRVAGRAADAGAHAGSHDPRWRGDFERGYHDGHEGRR